MKKVIHVIHDLTTGGAETLVKDYALMIDKSLFDIKVVCFYRRNSPYEELLKNNDISVIYLSDYIKVDRDKNVLFKIIFLIQLLFKLRKVLNKEKPDILHTHLVINTLIRLARPPKNTIIFHTIHNEPSILWKKNSIYKKLDFLSAKWLVKKYNMRFIVLHDNMREEANSLFQVSNSIVLNNGIDFSRFNSTNLKNKNDFRNELKIPKNAYIVGHIGRFMTQKNHEFLVDVFHEISKKKSNAFLLMIGSGDLQDSVEKKLESYHLKDKYLILSDRLDIPDLLNIMDCFVFPSKYEGLGIVLIEAQKMKIPCFISDTVPKHANISNIVTEISLNKSPEYWANVIVNFNYPDQVLLFDEDWDMKNIVKKLENIYLNKI